MKLSKILKEIRINNINKLSHFPNDEVWYIKIKPGEDIDRIFETLKMNGFTVDEHPNEPKRWFEASGNGSYLVHKLNRNELIWVTTLPMWKDFKQIQLNEIRIKNVNNPQNIFPKDEAWFMQVSSDDYFKTTNELFRQGFKIVDILENGDFVNDSYLLVYDLQVVNWDYDDSYVQIEYAEAGYKEIKQPVNEIKIRNANKPLHLPDGEYWYVKMETVEDVDKTWEYFKNTKFDPGINIAPIRSYTIHNNSVSYLKHIPWENTLRWTTMEPDNGSKQVHLNEIKIRNVNKPQLYFPKDKKWIVEVSPNNIDTIFDTLENNGFTFWGNKEYIYKIVRKEFLKDKNMLLTYGTNHMVEWGNSDKKNNYVDAGYVEVQTLNEIKIRNINNPNKFPTDQNWYVVIDRDNIEPFLKIAKEMYPDDGTYVLLRNIVARNGEAIMFHDLRASEHGHQNLFSALDINNIINQHMVYRNVPKISF